MNFAESPTSNYWSTRGSVLLSTLLMTRSLISHGYHIYGFAAAQLRWLGSINHFQYMTWPLNTSWWVTSQKVTTRQTSVWERNIKKATFPSQVDDNAENIFYWDWHIPNKYTSTETIQVASLPLPHQSKASPSSSPNSVLVIPPRA